MIAIVDYGMGNLASVRNAFLKVGETDIQVTGDPALVKKADGILLPGVGAFGDAMRQLEETGLADVLRDRAFAGVPFLGICLGFHLIFEKGYEGGVFDGLGLVKGSVVRFDISEPVPHMGWNTAHFKRKEGIFDSFQKDVYFYFDHAYFPEPSDAHVVAAVTKYEVEFPSAILKGNIMGTQFHPEKSHQNGLRIIRRFADEVQKRI